MPYEGKLFAVRAVKIFAEQCQAYRVLPSARVTRSQPNGTAERGTFRDVLICRMTETHVSMDADLSHDPDHVVFEGGLGPRVNRTDEREQNRDEDGMRTTGRYHPAQRITVLRVWAMVTFGEIASTRRSRRVASSRRAPTRALARAQLTFGQRLPV